MPILVTGALGFLGSRLVEKLATTGQDVIALVRHAPPDAIYSKPNIQWVELDVALDNFELSWLPYVDAVVHLAGTKESNDKSVIPFLVGNEQSTVRLLQAVSDRTDLFIFASSQMIYGNTTHLAVTEDFPLRPYDSPYACSKINSENWMRLFQARNGGRHLALRFCGFIDGGGFVDYLIDQALSEKKIQLNAHGKVRRDYLSSTDGIEALIAAINFSGPAGFIPINVGSGQAFSTLEIAELVCDELHSQSLIELNETPPPKEDFVFCIDRARELLNFQPRKLNEAVRQYAKHRQGQNREMVSYAKN
jgi:UDP-glucose 4-epimerase